MTISLFFENHVIIVLQLLTALKQEITVSDLALSNRLAVLNIDKFLYKKMVYKKVKLNWSKI